MSNAEHADERKWLNKTMLNPANAVAKLLERSDELKESIVNLLITGFEKARIFAPGKGAVACRATVDFHKYNQLGFTAVEFGRLLNTIVSGPEGFGVLPVASPVDNSGRVCDKTTSCQDMNAQSELTTTHVRHLQKRFDEDTKELRMTMVKASTLDIRMLHNSMQQYLPTEIRDMVYDAYLAIPECIRTRGCQEETDSDFLRALVPVTPRPPVLKVGVFSVVISGSLQWGSIRGRDLMGIAYIERVNHLYRKGIFQTNGAELPKLVIDVGHAASSTQTRHDKFRAEIEHTVNFQVELGLTRLHAIHSPSEQMISHATTQAAQLATLRHAKSRCVRVFVLFRTPNPPRSVGPTSAEMQVTSRIMTKFIRRLQAAWWGSSTAVCVQMYIRRRAWYPNHGRFAGQTATAASLTEPLNVWFAATNPHRGIEIRRSGDSTRGAGGRHQCGGMVGRIAL